MRRRPPITLLAHQQIERKACEIVGERLEIVGLVLVSDLAVRAALVTRFGLQWRVLRLLVLGLLVGVGGAERVIRDALGRIAIRALRADHVPFGGAQAALQESITLVHAADPHDARDRMRAADGAQAERLEVRHFALVDIGSEVGPDDL